MNEEEARRFLSSEAVRDAFIEAYRHAWKDRGKLKRELELPPGDDE